jgi:pilus assembly protein CpaB
MNLRRVLIALLLATVVAGGLTFLFYKRLRALNAERRVTQIVAANADLPSGMALAAKDVILLDWPGEIPLSGTFSKVEEVIGRPLIYPLGAKEPIRKRDLGVQGSGLGLSAKIPAGMRATAVRSNEIVGVAGFLYPGSHVDVLATYNVPGNNSPLTQTVLQDVEVLTAGQTIEPDPQGKPQEVSVVTLLVSPEDSQKLQLASAQGTVQFVLRSGADQDNVNLRPTRLDQLAGAEPTPVPPATSKGKGKAKKLAPPVKSAAVRAVEVIQGTQRSTQKFSEGGTQ